MLTDDILTVEEAHAKISQKTLPWWLKGGQQTVKASVEDTP